MLVIWFFIHFVNASHEKCTLYYDSIRGLIKAFLRRHEITTRSLCPRDSFPVTQTYRSTHRTYTDILSNCVQRNQNIRTDMTNSFIGAKRKNHVTLFSPSLSLSRVCVCAVECELFVASCIALFSQAIALLNNHNNYNNKCVGHENLYERSKEKEPLEYMTKCFQENYLLFRSIFLWWCFSSFSVLLYMSVVWCTYPAVQQKLLLI